MLLIQRTYCNPSVSARGEPTCCFNPFIPRAPFCLWPSRTAELTLLLPHISSKRLRRQRRGGILAYLEWQVPSWPSGEHCYTSQPGFPAQTAVLWEQVG